MHFRDYANYYNLLYRDKNYTEEAAYVHGLIQQFHPGAETIIDMGCGTGNHVFQLEKLGYQVKGVDLSESMIRIANERKQIECSQAVFETGDIREYRCDAKFDVVVSLFHVMSYQTSNDDLLRAIETVHQLLKPGGLFIFDCWYGPGVLHDLPGSRTKYFEDELLKVTRTSSASMDFNTNTVEVIFEVDIENKSNGETKHLKEVHPMRYLFRPELDLMATLFKMKILNQYHWMSHQSPIESTWYCVFVFRK